MFCVNPECKKEFESLHGNQKYCSNRCMYKYHKKNDRKQFNLKCCENCSKEFVPKNNIQKCCSKECRKKYMINQHIDRRRKIRLELITLLGGHCHNPYNIDHSGFEKDIDYNRCLQVDHVNGKGNKDRNNNSHTSDIYRRMIKEIKAGSNDYQLLCANCNWIKRHKNNEYN